MLNFDKLEEICYELYYEDLDIKEFETFIYDEGNQGKISDDDYLELISLNYNLKDSKYVVQKIIENYIELGKFETKRVTSYLDRALVNDDNLGEYLIEIYELYCHGYYFLRELALLYGVICTYTPKGYSHEQWYELPLKEKRKLHNSFQPRLNECLRRTLTWISNGDVIITGTKGHLDRWEYVDNRTAKDKEYDSLTKM